MTTAVPAAARRRRQRYGTAEIQMDYRLREITPGHFVQCNDAEFAQYRRQLGLARAGGRWHSQFFRMGFI